MIYTNIFGFINMVLHLGIGKNTKMIHCKYLLDLSPVDRDE